MEKFKITMTQKTTWEFEVEAESLEHAEELTRDWGRDDMNEDEITNNVWEIEIL